MFVPIKADHLGGRLDEDSVPVRIIGSAHFGAVQLRSANECLDQVVWIGKTILSEVRFHRMCSRAFYFSITTLGRYRASLHLRRANLVSGRPNLRLRLRR